MRPNRFGGFGVHPTTGVAGLLTPLQFETWFEVEGPQHRSATHIVIRVLRIP